MYKDCSEQHGNAGEIGDEGVEGFAFERGVAGEGFVEVIHLGLVMAPVMDLHRGFVDMRFERILRVGEIGKFVCHNSV